MGKTTKRSNAVSTDGTSSIKFNLNIKRVNERLATQVVRSANISPSKNMAIEAGISGTRFAFDTSELTKKPAINMTNAGTSV